MRVVVFGSSGLLGQSLVPYLLECGHEVLTNAGTVDGKERVDLSNFQNVRVALDRTLPDVIVNLAALTNVDECERNPQLAYLTNVKIVENIANWIKGEGHPCHLVQISTDQVYDGPGPHKEDDITLRNYYGFSKYTSELAAAAVRSTILRTNFFGRSNCSTRASLSDWLVRSLSKGERVTVFDDIRFSPLAIHSLVRLLEIVMVKRQCGLYNVGSKEGMTKADFAFALAEVLGLSTEFMSRGFSNSVNLAAYRPKDMRMDSAYFENIYGVNLPTLQEEIQSMKGIYADEAPSTH